jgi:hypothetical protein
VSFTEKILATSLAKITNLIPEGGIWLNTQRPEWNDANNALVGNGVSMVTLYYLRRFISFIIPVLEELGDAKAEVSEELAMLFGEAHFVLSKNRELLKDSMDDTNRKTITDGLGEASSKFRSAIYDHSFSGKKKEIAYAELTDFFKISLEYMEHSIKANQRPDNLYHAYNLMSYEDDGIQISYLPEMLEGQVAVLSSGALSPEESLEVLDALRNSALYREDQNSYILYPNKDLPGFLEKNILSKELLSRSKLLTQMAARGDYRIVQEDLDGVFHFNGNFRNAADLKAALSGLEDHEPDEKEKSVILNLFEEVFNHKAFTGRSGTFFGYEGLGSIYWHMVSKLYLAVYETCLDAHKSGTDENVQKQLAQHFHEVGEGIGVHKDPEVYGAFPVDPYSHTPSQKGAQQPGMTGQVKEDVLVRIGELGVRVEEGCIVFDPFLLKQSEFLVRDEEFEYYGLEDSLKRRNLKTGSLAFTLCEIPLTYVQGEQPSVIVSYTDGAREEFEGNRLSEEISREVFRRTSRIESITVNTRV